MPSEHHLIRISIAFIKTTMAQRKLGKGKSWSVNLPPPHTNLDKCVWPAASSSTCHATQVPTRSGAASESGPINPFCPYTSSVAHCTTTTMFPLSTNSTRSSNVFPYIPPLPALIYMKMDSKRCSTPPKRCSDGTKRSILSIPGR